MGSRAQIKINMSKHHPAIFLYTHWGSGNLEQIIYKGLKFAKKEGRIYDPEYLARIMFDTMKGSDINSSTDYGIGTSLHGDLDCWAEIDGLNSKVYFYNYTDQIFSSDYSIDEFLQIYKNEFEA